VHSKSSLPSQGSSLTCYPHSSQSALCTQNHRFLVRGHHLQPIHVHPSQHCALIVIALQSGVITYILSTSIPVSTVYSKSSFFSQGSSLTYYPRPSQSALCTHSHRSSVRGHHLHPIHVHPSQHLNIIWSVPWMEISIPVFQLVCCQRIHPQVLPPQVRQRQMPW
jgi:hypothetical protein